MGALTSTAGAHRGASHVGAGPGLRVPVAEAKLEPGRPRHRIVARPRLLEAVSVAVDGRQLTLVVGAPGTGKTTLLASWIALGHAPERTAFLALDAQDDSPQRFWAGVLAALAVRDACPVAGLPDAIAGLGYAGTTAELPVLLAAAIARCDGPVVLVLDDFHEITDERVLQGVAQLLRVASDTFRLVIASRSDPALPLPRLRVQRQLAEIRAEALSFTADETQRLLAFHGLTVRTDEVAALVARTEGWAAALMLALLTLRGSDAPRAALHELAGDGRALTEFMETELLDRLPPRLRDLLALTATVDELCAGLVGAIIDGEDGSDLLDELERRNCFLVSLDGRGEWFRYHRLFLELLRNRLARLPAAERAAAHARAGSWLADHGRVLDAMHHAIAAEDWALAVRLANDGWLDAFLVGRGATVRPLLTGLPRELAEREPAIAVALAAMHLDLGDGELADVCLDLARARINADDEAMAGLLAVVTLQAARARGDVPTAARIAALLLESVPRSRSGDSPVRRSLVLLMVGQAEFWHGDGRAASRRLRASIALARRWDQDYLLLGGLGYLALLQVVEGRLEAGVELAEEALELAVRGGWDEVAQSAPAWLSLGWAQLQRADPLAAPTLARAAAAARQAGDTTLELAVAAVLALARMDVPGGPRRGLELIRGLFDEVGERPLPPVVAQLAHTAEVRLLMMARSDDAEVAAALASAPPCAATSVLRARRALAAGDAAGARDVLAALVATTGRPLDTGNHIEGLVTYAIACRTQLDGAAAAEALERALMLADRDGYRWVFLQSGASLRDLLARQIRHGTSHRGLIDQLRVALDRDRPGGAHALPLLEPLSEREQCVLSYLETMLSTDEIAGELFVSTNTVKSHVKSIYRKLGVTRRRQAVLRARTLQLL